ncbi:MAG TPA: acyloxyacyl hydrolase [Gammaproteobacteria bacterium]|nr:acyloxyacyl hydrolase [Gammaproteobacteria bacterium]
MEQAKYKNSVANSRVFFMLWHRKVILTPVVFLASLFHPTINDASPTIPNKSYYGAHLTYAIITKEPPALHGYQFMLSYDPQTIRWKQLNLYFDGGFSHFWITNKPYYTTVNIYSIAPIMRVSQERGDISSYLDVSIGISYLNHTRLDNRNLGIHFAFQDRIGIGVLLGTSQQLSLGLQAIHYSNAHFSRHNSGITVPLMLDVGYRFQ